MSISKTKYFHEVEVHNTKAAEEVVPFILNLIKPNSVVDVGCGLGTWLKVFQDNGLKDILGIDGAHTDISKIVIDKNYFVVKDLENEFNVDRKFDLAVTLEVAEHLKNTSADSFIKSITQLSDIILFSAAIENQGGQNHINEQFPNYWEKLFNKYGFEFYDIIRFEFWENQNVDLWYRQNMLLAIKKGSELTKFEKHKNNINIVHPEHYINKLNQIYDGRMGFIFPFKILYKTILRGLKKLI